MLDVEDGEEFVFDIVQDIVQSTMDTLHDKYIASQTLPYTVQEARQVLLDIIEVHPLKIGYDSQSQSWLKLWYFFAVAVSCM